METKNFNVKIPVELHTRLKVACAMERKEMSEVVRNWIETYVKDAEKRLKLSPRK